MNHIKTKLQPPIIPQQVVERSELYNRLDKSWTTRLTLVSAPAGYGKTTLVTQWVHEQQQKTAWVTLDTTENSLIPFWSYFAESLRCHYPALHERFGNPFINLQFAEFPEVEQTLIHLVNELAEFGSDCFIILDNFEVISDPATLETIHFFLDHMPPQIHLLLISRTIPPLPLSIFRAKQQLLEFSTEHLRFSIEETRQFFAQASDKLLPQQDIEQIHQQVDGWVTGLQLTSLSMGEDSASHSIVHSLSGENYQVATYLMQEVFARQPETIQSFLLRTAILDRMSADLCDAVNNRTDSRDILATLYQSGLFISPLDTKHQWYVYHGLFREFLLTLASRQIDTNWVATHQLAGEWFLSNGCIFDSMKHFAEADDFYRLAQVLEQCGDTVWSMHEYKQYRAYASKVSIMILKNHPKLVLYYCNALLDASQYALAREYLTQFENEINTYCKNDTDSQGILSYLNAVLAMNNHQVETAIAHYEIAYRNLAPNSQLKITVKNCLGSIYGHMGKLAKAYSAYDTASQISQQFGQDKKAITSACRATRVRLRQGRLR